MELYTLTSILITVTALLCYVNHRHLGLPTSIAVMSASLLFSLLLLIIEPLGFNSVTVQLTQVLNTIDFPDLLLNGLLSFLLFAGSMTIDINSLRDQKWEITALACVGTIVSTILIGFASFYTLQWIQIPQSLLTCFLFGALISPTDPIAVIAIFKNMGAPRKLTTLVEGESLFNDGVGIVIFITLYQMVYEHTAPTFGNIATLFLQQSLGGIFYGLGLGIIARWLLARCHDPKVMIFLTLSITTGCYLLAQSIGVSGPLAMVVAGLVIGNQKSQHAPKTNLNRLRNFWEWIDDILNAVLFLLLGLEVLAINYTPQLIIASFLITPLVLLSRALVVTSILQIGRQFRNYLRYTSRILTWGGLRGGLAVALALSLPEVPERNIILSMTYAIVVFSIIFQGLSIKKLVKRIS